MDRIFLDCSVKTLERNLSRIETCLGSLTGEQVWARGGQNENAVGNLVLHLCGNVRQWIVSGAGGRPAVELAGLLRAVVREAADVLGQVTAERLTERAVIQGYDGTVRAKN